MLYDMFNLNNNERIFAVVLTMFLYLHSVGVYIFLTKGNTSSVNYLAEQTLEISAFLPKCIFPHFTSSLCKPKIKIKNKSS